MYLLDINVVSELRKPASRIDKGVQSWVAAQAPGLLYLSAITVFELELGVRRVERRDGVQGARLRHWLAEVGSAFEGRVLPFDGIAARRAAELQVPDPRSDHDCFIAATALAHGLHVVTRNERDFSPMGVRLVNPWSATQ